jgi:signal peptidase I
MSLKSKTFSVFVVAFVCAALLRTFVFESFIVVGDSMEPTIKSGDYVFINKLAFVRKEPVRGDIIVAKPRDRRGKVIKRVIGLPGERFAIEDEKVVIRTGRLDAGEILVEAYLSSARTPETGITLTNIDPLEYFALGDNREVSIDSRELGPVDSWDIKGKVFGLFRLSSMKFIGF